MNSPVISIESGLVFLYLDALAKLNDPFTLVTASNDDLCLPHLHHPCRSPELAESVRRLLENESLLAWYTKNPCLAHPKLHPLPLGPKWQGKTQRFFGESKAPHRALFEERGLTPRERFLDQTSTKTKLLYFNFGDTSSEPFFQDHAGVRARIKEALGPRFPWSPSVPFAQLRSRQYSFEELYSPYWKKQLRNKVS